MAFSDCGSDFLHGEGVEEAVRGEQDYVAREELRGAVAAVDFVEVFGADEAGEQVAAGVGLRGMMRDGSLFGRLIEIIREDMGAVHGADLDGAGVEESAIAYAEM